MVIEPFVRMGPLPRSPAAEANDCFMVRLPRGGHRIQGCGAIDARYGGLPSDCRRTVRLPLLNRRTPKLPRPKPIPFRYVTETEHATRSPARRRARPQQRRTTDAISRPPTGRATASQDPLPSAGGQTDQSSALVRQPSPSWSRCKPSMPPGTTRCPTACATVPPPRHFRPLSISTSKNSWRSCHRAGMGAIEPQQNQRRTRRNPLDIESPIQVQARRLTYRRTIQDAELSAQVAGTLCDGCALKHRAVARYRWGQHDGQD
jgi:hypothetical protein